jgi:hypothetical protein
VGEAASRGGLARARALNSLEFPEPHERWPKRVGRGRCDRWRIFASLLRHSCGSKTLESPLFDSFLAQNRWSNRRAGQADRVRLSLRRPSVTGSEPIIPQTWSSTAPQAFLFPARPPRPRRFAVTDSHRAALRGGLGGSLDQTDLGGRSSVPSEPGSPAAEIPPSAKLQDLAVPAAEPSRRFPGPTTSSDQPLPPPPHLSLAPLIRGDGFPRSHGPSKEIVNHQMVNVRLISLRPAVRAVGSPWQIMPIRTAAVHGGTGVCAFR